MKGHWRKLIDDDNRGDNSDGEEHGSISCRVAAEAFAAALFAQAGCDVSVQYGANQPQYDLLVSRGTRAIHVSVKGSQGGGRGLIQNYKRGRSYREAADAWMAAHKNPEILYCLVQFQGIALGECPRVYLAKVGEIAERHKASRNGIGETILWENYCYKKGFAKGWTDMIPPEWRFSKERVEEFLPSVETNNSQWIPPRNGFAGRSCAVPVES